jgi:hypothetical protein
MKKTSGIFMILIALIALSATASAQEAAEMVRTDGSGELRRAADFMVDPHGRNMPARLPATVSKGEVIAIRYQTSGNTFADSFRVTGITIKGDRCSIESKHNNADGRELIDMIFAQPCSKLK